MGFLGNLFKGKKKLQPLHITDANFHDEDVMSDVPVVLDVWGTNCAPCEQLAPLVMELAGEYDGRVKVCELLADKNPKTVLRYKIMGTPTVLYFKPRAQLVERVSGFKGWLYHTEIIDTDLLTAAAPPATACVAKESAAPSDEASEGGQKAKPMSKAEKARKRKKTTA